MCCWCRQDSTKFGDTQTTFDCSSADEPQWHHCGSSSGKTRLSSATRRRPSTARPQTSRSGIIAARHQRVLSAKKSREQSATDADAGPTRPTTAAAPGRRPMTAWSGTRPGTAVGRPGSSTRRPSTLLSSSMDSVTYETERSRMQPVPVKSSSCRTTDAVPDVTILTIDDDDVYEQVRQIG